MNKKALGIIIILAVIIGGYLLTKNTASIETETPPTETAVVPTGTTASITYENGAWNPATLTVKAGDTVLIMNKGASAIRSASAPHPSHTSQPDFDSNTLNPGETYTYVTKNPGKISFHNHFSPGALGEIIVQ